MNNVNNQITLQTAVYILNRRFKLRQPRFKNLKLTLATLLDSEKKAQKYVVNLIISPSSITLAVFESMQACKCKKPSPLLHYMCKL